MFDLALSSLDPLFRALYELVNAQSVHSPGESRIQAGHSFEDSTSRLVYSHAKACGLEAYPARQTMNLPTRSGNAYQFDASFSQGERMFLVECKRRQIPVAEHVHYFASKILDHNLATLGKKPRVRGIFLSTVEVGRNSMQFGFAFGLKIIDPSNPPLEELYSLCVESEPIRRALRKLWEQLESIDPLSGPSGASPQTFLKSYEFLKRRAPNLR